MSGVEKTDVNISKLQKVTVGLEDRESQKLRILCNDYRLKVRCEPVFVGELSEKRPDQ